jgi:hypothetical protein
METPVNMSRLHFLGHEQHVADRDHQGWFGEIISKRTPLGSL